MWWCRRIGAVALVVFAVAAAGTAHAADGLSEGIKRYDVDVTIQPNGELLVRETIDYDFGSADRHGIDRFLASRFFTAPGQDRVLYPGLSEHEAVEERRANGIPLHKEVIQWFAGATAEMGLAPLATL